MTVCVVITIGLNVIRRLHVMPADNWPGGLNLYMQAV